MPAFNSWTGVDSPTLDARYLSVADVVDGFVDVTDPTVAALVADANSDTTAALDTRYAAFSVASFGAVGDGTTDDTAAIQDAIDAAIAAGGGHVVFPAGVFRVASQLTIDCANEVVVDVTARGATINFEGSGIGLLIYDSSVVASPSTTEYNRGAHIYGGIWQGTTSGALGNTSIDVLVRVQDIVSTTFVGVFMRGATKAAGTCLQVYNKNLWTEQTTLVGCKFADSSRAIDFAPASVTGNLTGGTESFARTRAVACTFSGGVSGGHLINLSGDVYGSSFTDCGGNINPGASVYYLNGGHLGTTITNQDFEGGNASSYIFEVGPDIGANYPRISNVRVDTSSSMSLTADDPISDAHNFERGIRFGVDAAENGQISLPNGSAATDGIFARNAAGNADVHILRVDGSNTILMSTDGWPIELRGALGLGNDRPVYARNAANSGNVEVMRLDTSDRINIGTFGASTMIGGPIGFYGTAPVAQQTGVAVSAAGIHAALVALGLITA